MSSSEGQKVKNDPQAFNDPKDENPGLVTSDSLAAESIQEGGSFAANSDARGPMDQPSYSSNATTTDISSATRLDPAPDAEARQASEEWNEEAVLNSGLGSKARGGTDEEPALSDQTNRDWPKGENLKEGGFDSDAPNASYNTDIGGKKDPGRAALNKFEEDNTPYAGGAGPKDGEITGPQQFGDLDQTSA